MSKKTTSRSKTSAKTGEAPEPMDPSISESAVAAPATNATRPCWAIKTLCEEVWELFPETPVEYSEPNGRNTYLAVTFDLTSLDADTDRIDLPNLLTLISDDTRVSEVLVSKDDEGQPEAVLVEMSNQPRTMDLRDSFNLADALDILAEPEYDVAEDDPDEEPDEEPVVDGGSAANPGDDVVSGGKA